MSAVRRIEPTGAAIEKLLALPLLATLGRDVLDETLGRCALIGCPPGQQVVCEGEYDERFYVVVSGECEVSLPERADSEPVSMAQVVGGTSSAPWSRRPRGKVSLATLGPGDFFGELACMSAWPRTSDVRTTTDALLLEIDSEVFDEWRAAADGFREIMERAYLSRGLRTLLRAIEPFSLLGGDALDAVLEDARIVRLDRGEQVVREGEEGDALFVVRGGCLSVSKRARGTDRIVGYLRPGKCFGEMALLHGSRRAATVTAVGRAEVVRIPRDRLGPILEAHPRLAARLEKLERRRARATDTALRNDAVTDALSFLAGQGALGARNVLVVDLDRCLFCGHCEEACAAAHGAPLISLHGPTHRRLLFPTACRNCDDPLCLQECPVDAIRRDLAGEIVLDERCIGCGRCAVKCPYHTIALHSVPREDGLEPRRSLRPAPKRRARKCDLCAGIDRGPQCVLNCPTAALACWPPEEMVRRVTAGDP